MSPDRLAAAQALLELLPTFEDPDFVPATWPPRFHIDENGDRIEHMPYPDYHPVVERFRDLYWKFTAGVHPYEPLPEDETQEGIAFSPGGVTFPLEYFETASIDQIARFFVLMNRGERFGDGHIESQFKSGKVVAALRRLKELVGKE